MQMSKISLSVFIIFFVLMIASPVYSVKLIEEEDIKTPAKTQEITESSKKQIVTKSKRKPTRVKRSSQNTNKETNSGTPNKFKVSFWLLFTIVIVIIALLKVRKMVSNAIRSEERKCEAEAEAKRLKIKQAEEAKRRKEQEEAQLLREKKHYEYLCKKYGNAIADRLLNSPE